MAVFSKMGINANRKRASIAMGAGAGTLTFLQSSQQSCVLSMSRTPYAAPHVGPRAQWQVGGVSPNSNQLETFTGSAISAGALTVAAAFVSSSRGGRGGRG